MLHDAGAACGGYEHYGSRNVENPGPVTARPADVQQARTKQGLATPAQQHINEGGHFRGRFTLGVESTKKIGPLGELDTFVEERLTRRDHVIACELMPETKFFRQRRQHSSKRMQTIAAKRKSLDQMTARVRCAQEIRETLSRSIARKPAAGRASRSSKLSPPWQRATGMLVPRCPSP